MQIYELTLVLPVSQTKTVSERLVKTIKDSSGQIVHEDDWGTKILPYPIKKNLEANYLLYQLELEESRVGGFKRLLENDGQVLRYLLVKGTKGMRSTIGTNDGQNAEVKVKVEKKEKKEVKSKKKSTTPLRLKASKGQTSTKGARSTKSKK